MKELHSNIFTPTSCIYHYLNMARNNFREYLQGDEVKIKKYFYVLRPVLAAKWIEQYNEFPPLEFSILLEKLLPEGELKEEVSKLLKRKISGDELDLEPCINVINEFLNLEIGRLDKYVRTLSVELDDPTYELDELFRDTLEEVWS